MNETGFNSINRPARRRSRRLKMALEPLCLFRPDWTEGEAYPRYNGILKPATYLLGRIRGEVTTIENPAFCDITPAFLNGEPLDIKQGDLLIRLKHHGGTALTDAKVKRIAQRTRINFSLEVHSFEIRGQMFRIFGDLS